MCKAPSPTLDQPITKGPYVTQLAPAEEAQFQKWVTTNKIPWRDEPTADYDMRGFWKAMVSGDPNAKRATNLHFPDTYKTPYHQSFSNESQYAGTLPSSSKYGLPNTPHWKGNALVDNEGNVVFQEPQ